MPQVGFDPSFFRKERDTAYSDWKSAFWRELFQNSIDQHADRIFITAEETGGYITITFADNGPGMTRQVLENVYFAIGATTKTGSDTIGGFGRARIMTCFAMQSYTIRSHNYMVIGNGGFYDIVDYPHTNGCMITVAINDATVDEMTAKLHEFLSECRLDRTAIYLNNQLLTKRAEHYGKFIKDLTADDQTFAKVYVNKSASRHRAIIRVNGVSMYTTEINAKAQVIIELEPSFARKALTANRDGLRGEYRMAFNAFIRQLASDTNATIRDRFKRHTKRVEGGGMRRVRKTATQTAASMKSISSGTISSIIRPTVKEMPSDDFNEETESAHTIRDVFGDWLNQTFGDIYISDETKNTAMHKAVPNYLPENWKLTKMGGKMVRKGGNFAKVLLMWKTAIAYTLEVSLDILNKTEIAYAVGFLFNDDVAATHQSRDGGHVFSICPVGRDGKLKYAVRNRTSLKTLMSHAKHEVAHITQTWHDEDFCDIREKIDVEFDEGECRRRMMNALNSMPDFDREERMAA